MRDEIERREPRIQRDAAAERLFERGAVDSSGYRTGDLGPTHVGVDMGAWEDFQRGDAPLGMSPEQYQAMKAELEVALARDGLEDADVRLQGSAAFFYSRNPDKQFFASPDAVREHCAAARRDGFDVRPEVEEAAVERYLDAGYAEGPRPRDKMFDQDYVVTRLPEELSDYDIQISSDTLQAKMEDYQRDHPDKRVTSSHGGHWKNDSLQDCFRGLEAWTSTWTRRTGRDVNLAGFPGDGPAGVSGFTDEDWIIRRPQN
ncbi:MAG: hypothetical protein ACRD2C_15085 [Acidimicrobiales bacterium]